MQSIIFLWFSYVFSMLVHGIIGTKVRPGLPLVPSAMPVSLMSSMSAVSMAAIVSIAPMVVAVSWPQSAGRLLDSV